MKSRHPLRRSRRLSTFERRKVSRFRHDAWIFERQTTPNADSCSFIVCIAQGRTVQKNNSFPDDRRKERVNTLRPTCSNATRRVWSSNQGAVLREELQGSIAIEKIAISTRNVSRCCSSTAIACAVPFDFLVEMRRTVSSRKFSAALLRKKLLRVCLAQT